MLDRTWINVKLDYFYAHCEIQDDPLLQEKCLVIVDSTKVIGINHIAAVQHGLQVGQTISEAKQIYPNFHSIKINMSKYHEVSINVKKLLQKFDINMESNFIDEMNLDITEFLEDNNLLDQDGRLFIAHKIQTEIYEELGLTCSVGIGCNKMLSKLCSEINQPEGQTYLDNTEEAILQFMNRLEIQYLPGVGEVNCKILNGIGIQTCKQLVENAKYIQINFSDLAFNLLLKSALGIGKNAHSEIGLRKSLHSCEKFTEPIDLYDTIVSTIQKQCYELSERATFEKLKCQSIIIEFKCKNKVEVIKKQHTCRYYMESNDQYLKLATDLFELAWPFSKCTSIAIQLVNLKDHRNRISELISFRNSRKKPGEDLKIENEDEVKKTIKTKLPRIYSDREIAMENRYKFAKQGFPLYFRGRGNHGGYPYSRGGYAVKYGQRGGGSYRGSFSQKRPSFKPGKSICSPPEKKILGKRNFNKN